MFLIRIVYIRFELGNQKLTLLVRLLIECTLKSNVDVIIVKSRPKTIIRQDIVIGAA